MLDMDHQALIPPSTTMSTPVTYELPSEAKNIATFATSSGRPRRPSNVLPSGGPTRDAREDGDDESKA
jgi:hypothetical protein